MAIYKNTSPIITNGLVLYLDATNWKSIPNDPAVNLVKTNPTPINNLTGYEYAYGSPTASYNVISQSIEIESTNSPVGWVVNNTSLNSTTLDTRSLYTISFEWKPESDNTSLCRIFAQIVKGNNQTASYSNVLRISGSTTVSSQNTLLPNGWYLYSETFTPSHPGIDGDRSFRLLGGEVTGGQKLHIHWRKLQLQRCSYRTSFVSGSYQTWSDLSGNNNTATLLTSSISGGIPVFQSSTDRILTFDGTGSYASGTLASSLSGSAFTVGFWVKPTTSINNIPFSLGTLLLTDSTIHLRIYSNNVFRFGMYSDDLDAYNFDSMVGKWNYIVCTLDSSKLQSIYQNGVLKATRTALGMYVGNNTYAVGAWTSGPSEFTKGNIGPVHVYNRALTQAEIIQNYNTTKTRFGLT